MFGLRNVSKFAFTTFIRSVENFLKPNNMERKAILGIDIMFSQPNKNDLKSKEMMVIFLPLNQLGMHERKQHKPWFDEVCLVILDQRKQAKMQWMQDPSQSIVDNVNNVRRDASRHFRNKKKGIFEI
jgi:hypothetical protein